MDQLDKYIEEIVSKKITEPDNLEEIMLNAIHTEKGKKRIRRYKIMRALITSVTTVFVTAGVGVAGFIAYEKIWKNPERYTYEEVQETIAEGNNVGEIDNLITEEEAKKNATEIMKNLGYSNETIKEITLQKDINNNNEPFYNIITGEDENEGIAISINANTGKLRSFTNKNFKNIDIQNSQITENEAKEYADKIMEYAGFTDTEYEFTECKEENVYNTSKNQNIWVAKYNKKYDGLNNPYESLTSNFIINNNKVEISSIFETKDGTYDNNPTVLTSEEAIEIAINKEKELTSKEIESTEAEIGIRKMNNYIYLLENNEEFSNSESETSNNFIMKNNKIRKVWIINVYHKNQAIQFINDIDILKSQDKLYYIDASTGEIIGGEKMEL